MLVEWIPRFIGTEHQNRKTLICRSNEKTSDQLKSHKAHKKEITWEMTLTLLSTVCKPLKAEAAFSTTVSLCALLTIKSAYFVL